MIEFILRLKKLYTFCHIVLILFCLGYLTNSCCEDYQPIDVVPLYKGAIKAADPFDKFREGDALNDYVTF